MAEIDLKQFLRKHGFRHQVDRDRGANWGNGVLTVFVEKNYDREPGRLRALMDQVREAHRRKERLKEAEEKKFASAVSKSQLKEIAPMKPETPEEHREAQIESARVTGDTAPEVAADKGKKMQKFKGEERMYVYGRIKAMFQANMENAAIAAALTAEGIKMPSGDPVSASMVSACRWNWDKNPERRDRYAAILMPRLPKGVKLPEPTPPRPVVVAEAPKLKRSRFDLPLSVDTVLQDPAVDEYHRLQILLAFVNVPVSVQPVLEDPSLDAGQKMAVVEALGQKKMGATPMYAPPRVPLVDLLKKRSEERLKEIEELITLDPAPDTALAKRLKQISEEQERYEKKAFPELSGVK